MPQTNAPITFEGIDNESYFDKKIWDLYLPIMMIAADPILRSPLVEKLTSCKLDTGGVFADTTYTKKLTGRWEYPVSKQAVSIAPIGQGNDQICAFFRQKGWGQEDFAKEVMGANQVQDTTKVPQPVNG